MAELQIKIGKKENLDGQAKEFGQIFLTNDTKELYFDHEDENGVLQRSGITAGIYLGSGECPDQYNVQIDPDGTPLTIEEYFGDLEEVLQGLHQYARSFIDGGTQP